MSTTAEKLQVIIDNKAAIKQAIIGKGGHVGDFTTYAAAIANLPSSGGGGGDVNPTAEKNAVTFYDYDGTIRYSYTAEEFLALTKMPPLPTQKGLICQEWNWSYEDAMEYVAEYGVLDVGATYITDDGKTRLYIRIAAEGRMDVPLYFNQSVANGVVIDWGDGSALQTLNGTGNVNTTHHYSSVGDYIISLGVADGCELTLGHNDSFCVIGSTVISSPYLSYLEKVEIGASALLNISAFNSCRALQKVTIPNGIKGLTNNAFRSTDLNAVVIPSSVSNIGNYCFHSTNLRTVALSNSIVYLGNYAFQNCQNLNDVTMGVSLRPYYNAIFSNCSALTSIVLPNNLTSITASYFQNCYGIAFYDFSHHTAVPTLANANAFAGIPSDCKIIVPDALYNEWIAATNWSTYATYIIKKTDWDASKNNQ